MNDNSTVQLSNWCKCVTVQITVIFLSVLVFTRYHIWHWVITFGNDLTKEVQLFFTKSDKRQKTWNCISVLLFYSIYILSYQIIKALINKYWLCERTDWHNPTDLRNNLCLINLKESWGFVLNSISQSVFRRTQVL